MINAVLILIHLLTLAFPDGEDHLVLHAEDDRGHDHGGEGGLGDEGAVGHQDAEAEEHQGPGVEAAQGRLHPAGAVHRRPREAAGGRHRGDESAEHVADAERHHLLASIHCLSASLNEKYRRRLTIFFNLQKALAMAIDSRMAMMGIMMMAEPSSDNIPLKLISSCGSPSPVALAGMENGGRAKGGTLPSISPVSMKVHV